MKIGNIKGNTINKEFFRQGYIYKNWNNWKKNIGTVYVPELNDRRYTKQDFLNLVDGNEKKAEVLFDMVDWQCPETLLYELDECWEGRLYE